MMEYKDFKTSIWNRLIKYHERMGIQSKYIFGLRTGEVTALTGP